MGASDKEERDEDDRDEDEGDEKSHSDEAHDHDEDADKSDVKKEPAKAKADEKKPAEKAKDKPAEKTPAKPAAKAEAKAEADEGDEDEDECDEEDEGEDDEVAAKPVAKPAAAVAKKPIAAKSGSSSAKVPPSPGRARGRGKAGPPPARPQQGSLMKNMILFIGIIGILAAGFAILGKEEPQAAPQAPKWTVGQTVDVEITLVPNDVKELACAAPDEIGGKHCSFEAQGKPWSKGDPNDEKKVLRPYTTTDRVQFAAAGLWSQDALAAGKLPSTRFSVKCKYTVEGKLKNPNIRWSAAQPEQWYPQTAEWYSGAVSACVLAPP